MRPDSFDPARDGRRERDREEALELTHGMPPAVPALCGGAVTIDDLWDRAEADAYTDPT